MDIEYRKIIPYTDKWKRISMKMKVHEDERGWLIEAFRDEFAKGRYTHFHQAREKPGKHYHKRKKEWFCVLRQRHE